MDDLQQDLVAIAQIDVVPTVLDVVCRVTGMGFAAVARVTEDRWIACAVRDEIAFGLQPGGALKVETTICNEIRGSGLPASTEALMFLWARSWSRWSMSCAAVGRDGRLISLSTCRAR